jgi:hypothetical protein
MKTTLFKKWRLAPAVMAVMLACTVSPDAFSQSREEAARQAARQHNAKVLSVKEQKQGKKTVYVIKLLTKDGVVKTVRVTKTR